MEIMITVAVWVMVTIVLTVLLMLIPAVVSFNADWITWKAFRVSLLIAIILVIAVENA